MSETNKDHAEHRARRLADGWYAIHFCRECQQEKEAEERKPEYLKAPGCKTLDDRHLLNLDRWDETRTYLECGECGEFFIILNKRVHDRLLVLANAVPIGRVRFTERKQ